MIFRLSSLIDLTFLKRRSQRSRKSLLTGCSFLGGVLLCLFQSANAENIDYLDAVFSVEYNGKLTQGENHLKVKRDHHKYDTVFEFDHWLLSANQKASFEMNGCDVRPMSYVASNKLPLKDPTSETLIFDWDHKKASYTNKDEQKSFDLDTILYDPISFFFEARCDLMAGKLQLTHTLIHKGDKKNHTYKVVRTEMVETGQGKIEALVVERERDNKNRQTRFYVAPSLGYLLIKIEHKEGWLLNVVATLKSMDYKLADTIE